MVWEQNRSDLLPAPPLAKSGLGALADQSQSQFHRQVIYQLPFGRGRNFGSNWSGVTNAVLGGWEVTVIEKATSGSPIFVIDSNNTPGAGLTNADASSYIRPSQTCNPVLSHPTLPNGSTSVAFRNLTRRTSQCQPDAPLGPGFVNTDFQ
jgi:hypothetical protein